MSNPHHPKEVLVKRGYFYYLGFGFPTPVLILAQVLMLCAIFHAVTTRTLDDYFLYGGISGIPIAFFLGKLWVTDWPKSKKLSIWRKLFRFANFLSASLVLGAFYYSLGASVYDLIKWLVYLWDHYYTGPYLVGGAVLLIGAALFWFRSQCRGIYGLTEVVVGVLVASYKYAEASAGSLHIPTSDTNLLIALLTAGVYLVVRGLDNIQQGLIATPGDPILKPLVAWYKTLGELEIERNELHSAEHIERNENTG